MSGINAVAAPKACSFCHKSRDAVRMIFVTGPMAICDECVDQCVAIMKKERTAKVLPLRVHR